jgi:hypothetical protein
MARLRKHRHLLLSVLAAAFTALACAGLLTAAILVPAPAPVLVLVVAVSIGLPMRATWDLSRVAAAASRLDPAELRRQLDRLPETQHPLGL